MNNFKNDIDANGFIRVGQLKNFNKFIKCWNNFNTYNEVNPHDSLYKDYNVVTHSAKYGTYDFGTICPADMFIRRIKKFLIINEYVVISKIINETIKNTVCYIYDYAYANTYKANERTLIIKYISVDGVNAMSINIDDLKFISIHILTNEEKNIFKKYIELLNITHAPIHDVMKIKTEYVEDYKLYCKECKKYNFKPLSKKLLQISNVTDFDMYVDKNGNIVYYNKYDINIINKGYD